MPLLSFLLSHYLLTSQIILHQGEFVVIEEPENENVFLNLVFLTILPQESCHCVRRRSSERALVDVQLAPEAFLEVRQVPAVGVDGAARHVARPAADHIAVAVHVPRAPLRQARAVAVAVVSGLVAEVGVDARRVAEGAEGGVMELAVPGAVLSSVLRPRAVAVHGKVCLGVGVSHGAPRGQRVVPAGSLPKNEFINFQTAFLPSILERPQYLLLLRLFFFLFLMSFLLSISSSASFLRSSLLPIMVATSAWIPT